MDDAPCRYAALWMNRRAFVAGSDPGESVALLEEAEPERCCDCVRAGARVQALAGFANVRADRLRADREPLADLIVGQTVRDLGQDFRLTRRERGLVRGAVEDDRRQRRIDVALPGADRLQ